MHARIERHGEGDGWRRRWLQAPRPSWPEEEVSRLGVSVEEELE
jgi:hypothetical protein